MMTSENNPADWYLLAQDKLSAADAVFQSLGATLSCAELLHEGVYERSQTEAIRHRFELLESQHVIFALNHGDLSPRNTIVDEAGHIVLLDWGCAEAHLVPHYELLCMMQQDNFQESRLQAFTSGYGLSANRFADVRVELDSLRLLKAFDLVRWAIDRNPARVQEKAENAQHVMQSLTL